MSILMVKREDRKTQEGQESTFKLRDCEGSSRIRGG